MFENPFNRYAYISTHFPDWYKTQKICESFVWYESFMLKYCLNRHWDSFALRYVPDWFVKIIDNADLGKLITWYNR